MLLLKKNAVYLNFVIKSAMGRFLNKGTESFRTIRNSEFVDKSRLIDVINKTLNTERMFTCVSRARRFGKSIAAKMLYSYYDKWSVSEELFKGLEIEIQYTFPPKWKEYAMYAAASL